MLLQRDQCWFNRVKAELIVTEVNICKWLQPFKLRGQIWIWISARQGSRCLTENITKNGGKCVGVCVCVCLYVFISACSQVDSDGCGISSVSKALTQKSLRNGWPNWHPGRSLPGSCCHGHWIKVCKSDCRHSSAVLQHWLHCAVA